MSHVVKWLAFYGIDQIRFIHFQVRPPPLPPIAIVLY